MTEEEIDKIVKELKPSKSKNYSKKLDFLFRFLFYLFMILAVMSLIIFDNKLMCLIFMLSGIISFTSDVIYFLYYYPVDEDDY